MSVTPGFVALWLYVASCGLMALLRNVKIHKKLFEGRASTFLSLPKLKSNFSFRNK